MHIFFDCLKKNKKNMCVLLIICINERIKKINKKFRAIFDLKQTKKYLNLKEIN